MQREIIKITQPKSSLPKRKKVAAYARVSSEKDSMMHSLSAQISYYSKLIQDNPNWEYAGVYADEAKTGTKDLRPEFQRLLEECKQGKIDIVITKSISRFARNTVDTLTTVRKLKEKGVKVYFEKENIYTLDSKGELLITIMSSLAQKESRSISENVTWGQRKRFADGKVSLPYKKFLGYEKGEDGFPKIIEKEAGTVRLIYRLFLEGKTISAISKYLTDKHILTPAGNEKWHISTVHSILTNEKYSGNALLQKCYTVDFLTKKLKKNEGEVPQYYVKNSHEAIISPEVYDLVQSELKKRSKEGSNHSCRSLFSSKIVCGDCGSFYGSKIWHSNDKYRKIIWQCNKKFKNKEKCKTPYLTEEQIKDEFVKAVNNLISNKEEVIKDCENTILSLTNIEDIDTKISKLQEESEIVIELMKSLIYENSRKVINQDEYNKKYNFYTEKYEKIKLELSKLEDKKQDLKVRRDKIKIFIDNLKNSNKVISEFDEKLWYSLVERVIVYADGNIEFKFKNSD